MVSKIKKVHIEQNLKSNNNKQEYINKHTDAIKELGIDTSGATDSGTSGSSTTNTNTNTPLNKNTKKAFDYFFYAHNMLKIYKDAGNFSSNGCSQQNITDINALINKTSGLNAFTCSDTNKTCKPGFDFKYGDITSLPKPFANGLPGDKINKKDNCTGWYNFLNTNKNKSAIKPNIFKEKLAQKLYDEAVKLVSKNDFDSKKQEFCDSSEVDNTAAKELFCDSNNEFKLDAEFTDLSSST